MGEHHDGECRKRERIRKAPGLKLERLEEGARESCTAAEETRECISNLSYVHRNRWVARVRCVVEFQLTTGVILSALSAEEFIQTTGML